MVVGATGCPQDGQYAAPSGSATPQNEHVRTGSPLFARTGGAGTSSSRCSAVFAVQGPNSSIL